MRILTLPRRSRFQYALGDWTTAIPIRPWVPGDRTFGGVRRNTGTGLPAVDHLRRDDLFFLTLRLWEAEWPDLRAFVRAAMQGEPFTWTPDIEFPDDTLLCYLQRPAAGERWSPRRLAEYPRVLEADLVLRQTDAGETAWGDFFTPSPPDLPEPGPITPIEPSGDVYFATRFANGDKSDTMNGVHLLAGNAQVIEFPSPGGSPFVLRHRHTVSNSNQEQRFDHPTLRLPGYYFGLYERFPANYFHRDGPSTDNNKYWRAWSGNRSDGKHGYQFYRVKGGFSTDKVLGPIYGASRMLFEYGWSNLFGEPAGVGERGIPGTEPLFASAADRWYKVQGQIWLSSEPGVNDGILRLWVDNVLIQEATDLDFYSRTPGVGHYIDAGYWNGATNSGWNETTDLFTAQVRLASTLLAADPDNISGWAA